MNNDNRSRIEIYSNEFCVPCSFIVKTLELTLNKFKESETPFEFINNLNSDESIGKLQALIALKMSNDIMHMVWKGEITLD